MKQARSVEIWLFVAAACQGLVSQSAVAAPGWQAERSPAVNPAGPAGAPGGGITGFQPVAAESGLAAAQASGEHPSVPADLAAIAGMLDSLAPEGWLSLPAKVSAGANPQTVPGVDGQPADIVREYKFDAYLIKFFQRGQRLIYIKVYGFADTQGAFGAYSTLRRGASTVVTLGDASSEDDQSISFWKGRFFVSVYTTAEDDEEAKGLVTGLARGISDAIAGGGRLPGPVSQLPRLDRIKGSEKFVMGPIGAGRFLRIPFVGSLNIGGSRGAAIADYRLVNPRPERLQLIVVEYGDRAAAIDAYRRYTANLEEAHDGELSESRALFKTGKSYLLCELEGNCLAVITGAKQRLSPMMLSRQLKP